MDTICGIGLPELIVLALVGFVVVGPERSREMALQLGRLLRRVMKSSWWKEFNQIAAAIRDMPATLVRMAELEDDLKSVRSDLERATHIDYNQPGGSSTQPPGAPTIDPARDPWGVGVRQPPPPPPGTPASPPSDTTPPPAGSEQPDHE